MFDPDSKHLVIGVVGAGLMGRGIAQIAAQAGIEVRIFDTRAGAADEAVAAITATFDTLAAKGKLEAGARDAAVARLRAATALADLAGCALVIEAIVENLDAKRALFCELESVVADDCLLATNTSSLSVTAIASACRLPGRVGGFHFFSPVPLMKVVEVIDSAIGEARVGDALVGLARRLGHRPVRASDTPGFVVNHAGRGLLTEGLRVLGEGIAQPAEVDRILRAAGFRMGPFELMDMVGLDVSRPVMESIYEQYYQEPRYRPSPIIRQRLAGGLLGRKSGRGFYTYADGKPVPQPDTPLPALAAIPLWVDGSDPARRSALLARTALGCVIDDGAQPGPDSACVVFPVGTDATGAALDAGLDPRRTLAIDPLFMDSHISLMGTPITAQPYRDAVLAALGHGGASVTLIRDSAGCVAQRVVAMIVNIGCDIAQQRIATPEDIDAAVTLGLGYPKGPLAWGDAIGAGNILAILERLLAITGDPRYRPSLWLRRRAQLGLSLTHPEA